MNDTNFNEFSIGGKPKEVYPNSFATASRTLGVLSLFCTFSNIYFGSFIFGGLAIILAVLSKGSSSFASGAAKTGLICGSISVAIEVFVFAVGIYSILFIPEVRQQFNTLYNQMYEQIYGEEPKNEALDSIFNHTDIPRVEGGDL